MGRQDVCKDTMRAYDVEQQPSNCDPAQEISLTGYVLTHQVTDLT